MQHFLARLIPAVLAVQGLIGASWAVGQSPMSFGASPTGPGSTYSPVYQPISMSGDPYGTVYQPMSYSSGGYVSSAGCAPAACGRPVIDTRVYAPPHWDDSAPIEQFLTALAKNSWLRTEYLIWTIQDPGLSIQSAPIADVRHPTVPFNADPPPPDTLPLVPQVPVIGEAVLPNLSAIELRDANGIRGTYGLAIANGVFELNAWGLEKKSDTFVRNMITYQPGDLSQPPTRNLNPDPNAAPGTFNEAVGIRSDPNVIVAMTANGVPTNRTQLSALVFDDTYSARLNSQLWGAEVTYTHDYHISGEGCKLKPLCGFRFINLDEDLGLRGVGNAGRTQPDSVMQINADTTNYVYGPEVGVRAELVHRWFTLSATPTVAFALNQYRATADVSLTDGSVAPINTTSFRDRGNIDFTPVAQIALSAELHLNDCCSLFASYDAMWIHRVTRPFDNINYDSTPIIDPATNAVTGFIPNIHMQTDLDEISLQGVSAGLVIRLR